ncbi:MAG: hypothetical protein GF332_00555 [Candidatus Moranbacteria bacterium]|nr:hypothetical protein [Candidatus Moranbacteria bacterium]
MSQTQKKSQKKSNSAQLLPTLKIALSRTFKNSRLWFLGFLIMLPFELFELKIFFFSQNKLPFGFTKKMVYFAQSLTVNQVLLFLFSLLSSFLLVTYLIAILQPLAYNQKKSTPIKIWQKAPGFVTFLQSFLLQSFFYLLFLFSAWFIVLSQSRLSYQISLEQTSNSWLVSSWSLFLIILFLAYFFKILTKLFLVLSPKLALEKAIELSIKLVLKRRRLAIKTLIIATLLLVTYLPFTHLAGLKITQILLDQNFISPTFPLALVKLILDSFFIVFYYTYWVLIFHQIAKAHNKFEQVEQESTSKIPAGANI